MTKAAADELKRVLQGGAGLEFMDSLKPDEAMVLVDGLHAAQAREKQALDDAIENSLAMVPLLLRGTFKRILFP
ncbi:MAG: hypothetical protein ACRETW_12005 [Stenotrophobium sp.]